MADRKSHLRPAGRRVCVLALALAAVSCGAETSGTPPEHMTAGGSQQSASSSATSAGGTSGVGSTGGGSAGTGTTAGSGGASGSGGSGGAQMDGGAGARDATVGPPSDGAAPPGFWDTSNIPPATKVMMFKFLNRTNGKYQDSQVFWSFKNGAVSEVHSIAEQPLYDMPANASGRMYFYLEAPNGKYTDFIEFTIGPTQFNGNTTRVDAFGLKIAMRLHCADGFDVAVGEDYATFLEDRDATFQKFVDEVPEEFKHLAQIQAPYRIVEPGAGQFKAGGTYAQYFAPFVDELWAANGLTIPKPGPNGSGLGSHPDVSAAIFRHVGSAAGSFSPDGKLMNKSLWADSRTFYSAPPANYYARFWHVHGLNGKAYGFPYDDVGGYSSYVSHQNPQYILIAIGW